MVVDVLLVATLLAVVLVAIVFVMVGEVVDAWDALRDWWTHRRPGVRREPDVPALHNLSARNPRLDTRPPATLSGRAAKGVGGRDPVLGRDQVTAAERRAAGLGDRRVW